MDIAFRVKASPNISERFHHIACGVIIQGYALFNDGEVDV
jgi:hypothetical protein